MWPCFGRLIKNEKTSVAADNGQFNSHQRSRSFVKFSSDEFQSVWLSSAASLWPRNNDTKGLLLTMARFKHKKVTEQTVTRLLSHGQRQPPSRTISCQAHRTRDIFCFESELWFVQGWNHVCQLFSASQEGTGHAGRRYLNYFNQVKKGDCLLSSAAKRD